MLVGPNNEGKSNLLRALDLGLAYLKGWANLPENYQQTTAPHFGVVRPRPSRTRETGSRPEIFDYESDFPMNHKRYVDGSGQTTIRLNFSLSEIEAREFKDVTGSQNNGQLPIKLTLTKKSVKLEIVKPGRGNSVLAAKSVQIAQRVVNGLDFHYIPAVRGSEHVTHLVTGLVRRKLRSLALEEDYVKHVAAIDQMRNSALSEVHKALTGSLEKFLPNLQSIRLETLDSRDIMRVSSVHVNDGIETLLESKGDGIQSLAAISLMQETAALSSAAETLVLAVEEPESHLHPAAVHQVRRRLQSIAASQQVVITTHSPLLVNRYRASANIIVEGNKARAAESLDEVRKCLGVRTTDNLHSSDLVILVEGVTDKRALTALMKLKSPTISRALAEGRIAVMATRGAGKLESRLASLQATITPSFVIFDKDQAGQRAIQSAVDSGLLTPDGYVVFNTQGMREAELEDMYSTEVTIEAVKDSLRIDISAADLGRRNTKWSNRLSRTLDKAGKIYDEQSIEDVKVSASRIAERDPSSAFDANWSKILLTAISKIETLLDDVD